MNSPTGWHDRGYLPHFDASDRKQAITFRLADSLPKHVTEALHRKIEALPEGDRRSEEIRQINRLLDVGFGSCILREIWAAAIVQEAFFYGHGRRYDLEAWVIMPNHVHALIKPFEGQALGKIVASWKKRSSREINKVQGKRGNLWYREYFDRYQRDEDHRLRSLAYIEANPVKAGLCAEATDWRWSSTRFRTTDGSLDWDLVAATIGLPEATLASGGPPL